ncbi:MAG: sodium:calcium symporter, partial [Leptospiraceae bacterium]|nr:sodium:calcium symporter [Leptospiraceae bacterium]
PEPRNKTFMESLLNAEMWMEAAGQVFFSLSVGFGVIITYSSYVRRNEDVVLSGTTSASGNIFAEVALGGLITIPAAFIFLGPAGISDSTFALGFETLPQVFQAMPVGNFFGFVWFFLLFLAAITSSLSMLQPAIAFFEEGLGLERKTSVTFLGLITLLGTGFVAFFSDGNRGLGYMDFWVGTFAIYLLALLQVLVGAWVFGAEKAIDEANRGSYMKLPRWVGWIWRYVSPAFLIGVFVLWVQQELPKKMEALEKDVTMQLTVTFLIVLSLFFLVLISAALRRWKKQEKEDL